MLDYLQQWGFREQFLLLALTHKQKEATQSLIQSMDFVCVCVYNADVTKQEMNFLISSTCPAMPLISECLTYVEDQVFKRPGHFAAIPSPSLPSSPFKGKQNLQAIELHCDLKAPHYKQCQFRSKDDRTALMVICSSQLKLLDAF